jgi:hypothetical protein
MSQRKGQVLSTFLAIATVSACQPGRHSFAQMQVCLGSAQAVEQFKEQMRSLAGEHNLKYIDGSVESARGLKEVGATADNMHADGGLIHLGLEGKRGSLTAGNMGLGLYEVGIGFGHEPDPAGAKKFADAVTLRLSQRWKVRAIPPEVGMFPDSSCKEAPPAQGAP